MLSRVDSYPLQELLLSLVIITLPISIKANSIAIILWGVHLLLFERTRWQRNFSSLWKRDRAIFLAPALYLLQLVGLAYTEDFSNGFRSLETKLSLLILPLLIVPMSFSQKSTHLFTKVFILTVFCSALFCHAVLLVDLIQAGSKISDLLTSYLYQTSYLTKPLLLSPIYFSLYTSFAILLCLWFLISEKKYFWLIPLITYLQFFNFMLISRTALMAQLMLSAGMLIYYWGYKEKRYALLSVSFLLFITAIYAISTQVPDYKHRFSSLLSHQSSETSTGLHMNSWRCALLSNKGLTVIFGQGSGDELTALKKCYQEKGLFTMVDKELNSHSEFLSTYVRHGLIGVLFLLGVLIAFVRLALQKGNVPFILFILLFAMTSMTESTLSVQKGVVYFSLLSSLLLSVDLTKFKLMDTK